MSIASEDDELVASRVDVETLQNELRTKIREVDQSYSAVLNGFFSPEHQSAQTSKITIDGLT